MKPNHKIKLVVPTAVLMSDYREFCEHTYANVPDQTMLSCPHNLVGSWNEYYLQNLANQFVGTTPNCGYQTATFFAYHGPIMVGVVKMRLSHDGNCPFVCYGGNLSVVVDSRLRNNGYGTSVLREAIRLYFALGYQPRLVIPNSDEIATKMTVDAIADMPSGICCVKCVDTEDQTDFLFYQKADAQ